MTNKQYCICYEFGTTAKDRETAEILRSDITRLLVSKFPLINCSHGWIEEMDEE